MKLNLDIMKLKVTPYLYFLNFLPFMIQHGGRVNFRGKSDNGTLECCIVKTI